MVGSAAAGRRWFCSGSRIESFPLVFYRENCADMAPRSAISEEAFIASSRALLITGTHFSTGQVD